MHSKKVRARGSSQTPQNYPEILIHVLSVPWSRAYKYTAPPSGTLNHLHVTDKTASVQ